MAYLGRRRVRLPGSDRLDTAKHGLTHDGEEVLYIVKHPAISIASLFRRKIGRKQMVKLRAFTGRRDPAHRCQTLQCFKEVVNRTGRDGFGVEHYFDVWSSRRNVFVCTLDSLKQHEARVACLIGAKADFFKDFVVRRSEVNRSDEAVFPVYYAVYDKLWGRMQNAIMTNDICR